LKHQEALQADQDDEYIISNHANGHEAECLHGRLQAPFGQTGQKKSFKGMCVLQGEKGTM